MDQGLLTSSLWYISICIIVIIVWRMSFLVSAFQRLKILWVKLFLICYHCQMKAVLISPFSSLGNYTFLSFCVRRNCHWRAISVPMLAYFLCLHSFFSHMGIFLSVWAECTVYPCINGSTCDFCCSQSRFCWEVRRRIGTGGNGNFLLMSDVKDSSLVHMLRDSP